MPGTSETLWTDFNGRKIAAERAIKDAKGRNLADNIDKIPSTYVSGAALSNNNKTLTLTLTNQSTSPATTSTVALTDTGDANVQSDWSVSDNTSDAYIANKPAIIIPLASAAAQGGYAAPQYLMVVDSMPAAADIDPNTIYLVKEAT